MEEKILQAKNYIAKIKNNKILLGNMCGTFIIKGLSLIVSLFTVTVYLNYFKDQKVLGVWLAIQSILNWILTFDMGIGNGLRNTLTKFIVDDNYDMQKKCISSAYVVLGLISLAITILGTLAIGIIDWNTVLNISSEIIERRVLAITIQMSFIGIMLYFWLKLIFSILYALQKTAVANLISLLSHSLILVFALLFKGKNVAHSLIVLSFAQVLTINLPIIITSLVVFMKKLKRARPSLKYYDKGFAGSILKLGYMFLWVQVTLLIINSTNDILITRLYGPECVVEYNVYNRIFMLFVSFFSIITNPVWSTITNEYSKNNITKIKKIYMFLTIIGIGVSCLCFVTVPIFPFISKLVVGTGVIVQNNTYALSFATFSSVMVMIYSITCVANGINDLKPQIIGNTVAAILKIPCTIFLSHYIPSWICIIWVNTFLMIPALVLQIVSLRNKLSTKKRIYEIER